MISAAIVLKEIVKRNPQIPAEEIEDVILGCANQAGEDNRNVARMASLLAELPVKIGGETVNRLCASGMAAIANALQSDCNWRRRFLHWQEELNR